MPKLRVEFKCEGCGERVHLWTQQLAESIQNNSYELGDDCDNGKLAEYLICRKCEKTVVYHDVIHVETKGDEVAFSTRGLDGKAGQHLYFQVQSTTMDAICDAWQKHRA